jgi:broad specificity phosphatase PhoE
LKASGDSCLVYIVRHGESVWNSAGRIQGQQDPDLSPRGVEQSESAASKLSNLGLQAVHSSDLLRARRTAEIIALGCGLSGRHATSPALREACLGEWEGKTVAELESEYPELLARWMTDSAGNRPPGGESLEALQDRVVSYVVSTVTASLGSAIVVVTHGGPIKAVVTHVLGAGVAAFPGMRTDNCGITTVRYDAARSRFVLVGFNDTSHLGARDVAAPSRTVTEAAEAEIAEDL